MTMATLARNGRAAVFWRPRNGRLLSKLNQWQPLQICPGDTGRCAGTADFAARYVEIGADVLPLPACGEGAMKGRVRGGRVPSRRLFSSRPDPARDRMRTRRSTRGPPSYRAAVVFPCGEEGGVIPTARTRTPFRLPRPCAGHGLASWPRRRVSSWSASAAGPC